MMPKITGAELSKYVKKARPDLKVLIMSSVPVHKEEWHNLIPFTKYMDDFIAKTSSIEEITDVIRRLGREQSRPKEN
jgi:CheY-like chemotaxis protein